MSQLIKITTIPIKIAVNVERGRFEKVEPEFYEKTQRRVQQVAKEPISTQAQSYSPETVRTRDEYVPVMNSIQATIPVEFATIDNVLNMRIANAEGQFDTTQSVSAAQVKQQRITNESSNQVAYVPNSSDEIKWQPSALNLQIDMNINDPNLKYVPGSISFEVEQYPSVQIEYLGGPMYCPPSSDPNYKGDK